MIRSNQHKKYVGIDKEAQGGMTAIGKMIRDAWVFELIAETETCENWTMQGIEALLHKVNDEWVKYGCLVSNLPPELSERHKRIHDAAIAKAREAGWSGEFETDDEG